MKQIGDRIIQLTIFAFLVFAPLSRAETAPFEFLYIDANEGTASGGHVAARLGDEVFHYQHVAPGLLRLYRDDYPWFLRHYGVHENRNIHAHPITLPPATQQHLYDELDHRRLVQDEHFAALHDLAEQIALLKLLRARRHGGLTYLSVPGAGLFSRMATTQEPALLHLRQDVEIQMLRQKAVAMSQALQHPFSLLQRQNSLQLSRLNYQPNPFTAVEQYKNQLLLGYALEVLIHAYPLQQTITLEPAPAEFILGVRQIHTLENYRQKLQEELRKIILNPQPDKALALISGMAQLAVIRRSIDSGALFFLNTQDDTPAPAPHKPPHIEHGEVMQGLFKDARERWLQAKTRLDQTENLSELDYRQLEKTANAFMYYRQSLLSPAPAQLVKLQTAPINSAELDLPPTDLSDSEIQRSINELEQVQTNLTAQLTALYGYNLILRNCVTELLQNLSDILPDNAEETHVFKQIALQPFAFIPFVSYESIAAGFTATHSYLLPSQRNRLLVLAKKTEHPIWVAVRESNTLTAALYRVQPQTAFFLFFSEDTLWLRPFQGYANAALGLLQMGSGLLTLPWDSGENLKLGASALLVSLPEWFLINIRKGSYPEWTQPIY